MIIRDEDCKSDEHIELPIYLPEGLNRSLLGRVVAEDVHKPLASGKPGKTLLAEKGAGARQRLLAVDRRPSSKGRDVDDAARCARC